MEHLLEAIVSLMTVVITYYFVPWLKAQWNTETQREVDYWIRIGVSAAEQIFASGQGAQKLEYVQTYLKSMGMTVGKEEIEAAVYWLANSVTSQEGHRG